VDIEVKNNNKNNMPSVGCPTDCSPSMLASLGISNLSLLLMKIKIFCMGGAVTHTYNFSYSGGGDQKDGDLRPT
jgi:hypothetical protein